MSKNLWSTNKIQEFWKCRIPLPDIIWKEAAQKAMHLLGFTNKNETPIDPNEIHTWILSEAQFGEKRWDLNLQKRIYYLLKPFLPRNFTRILRRVYGDWKNETSLLNWPIEDQYAKFLWETMRQVLKLTNLDVLEIRNFWPRDYQYAFILTHDIETARGQANVRQVMDLEERFGFRSSLNFVPERYEIDKSLIQEARERGFEIGIHGLKHDGKLFFSYSIFKQRAKKINYYLNEYGAVGFRSPLTHRNPYWMQSLEIEYDLSFFDTDPFEPIPGGTMSLWPFIIGNFIELPYTLPQDYTIIDILGETSSRIWLQKVDLLKKFHGMALVNVHPDYLIKQENWNVYEEFLTTMKKREDYWHALPREAARWWRKRMKASTISPTNHFQYATINIKNNKLNITT